MKQSLYFRGKVRETQKFDSIGYYIMNHKGTLLTDFLEKHLNDEVEVILIWDDGKYG